MLKKPRHGSLIKILRYNFFQLCLNSYVYLSVSFSAVDIIISKEEEKNQSKNLDDGNNKYFFGWRAGCLEDEQKPVWVSLLILRRKTVKITLKLLSPQKRYRDHQGGIWKIMGKAIFFVKGPILIKILVNALDALEVVWKSPLFKYLSIIFFFSKT